MDATSHQAIPVPTTTTIMKFPAVMATTGLSRSSVYLGVERGHFPKPVKLVPGGRAVGWVRSEIDAYMHGLVTARGEWSPSTTVTEKRCTPAPVLRVWEEIEFRDEVHHA
jgi:prophage regulatory protein